MLAFSGLSTNFQKPDKIEFENNDYNLIITKDDITTTLRKQKFPYETTQDSITDKKIIIFPKAVESNENILASLLLSSISRYVNAAEIRETVSQTSQEQIDMIIRIQQADKDPDTVKIMIPANDKFIVKNRKLASLIQNNVIENQLKALVIPIQKTYPDTVIVEIEAGKNIVQNQIADAIAASIQSYYTK